MLLPLLALVGLPLLMLVLAWFDPQGETWEHLRTWLLPRLIGHTALMFVVVGIGVAVIGVGMAWLSACCEYPGRRWLDPLLVLPLAFPPYVFAFIYLGILDFAGPIQSAFRSVFGSSPAWIEALSRPGAVLLILILAFYPYVYLLARASFASGGRAAFEAGRSLGIGPFATFFKVSLPMARPALVAGMTLALMETLADFGAVSIFGFDTFTTAIYRTWFGLFNLSAAVQLASILMLFVLVLIIAERLNRGERAVNGEKQPRMHRIQLRGARAGLATAGQIGLVLIGVVVPLVQLLIWAWPQLPAVVDGPMLEVIGKTMTLGFMGSVAVVLGGILLLAGTHKSSRRVMLMGEVSALGYAIPGTVLAVAIMLAFTRLDQWTGSAPAGGLLAVTLAYLIRFVRVAWGPLEAVACKIRPEYGEVARSLGVSPWRRYLRIHLPLIWPGLLTAFLLALVEIAKEMPATLMLRPFGWDTLAIRIYELTAEGQWERAAIPSLVLVCLGAIPVVLLVRRAIIR